MPQMNPDYERVAKAIRFLAENASDRPSLDDVAKLVGLSPFHFQRTFTRLAGVSPKQFLQALTAIRARKLLADSASVLDAALEVGLSGPGRLHDLMVTLEAMTPGEMKAGGHDLSIRAGFAATPFGRCLVASTARGVCRLAFVEPGGEEDALSAFAREWPNAEIIHDDSVAEKVAAAIFGRDTAEPLTVHVRGTNFQVQVWRAILSIPPGRVASYGKVAAAIRSPGASRAVGTALAKNPVALLVPCHRVIRETGVIGEYHWGSFRKEALLAWESAKSTVKPAGYR